MVSPSFEGFYTQLDCKPIYGNKNETQPALVWCISLVFKNKTEQNRNDDKYSQTGITVQTRTNHTLLDQQSSNVTEPDMNIITCFTYEEYIVEFKSRKLR